MKDLILELDYMSGPIVKDTFDIQKGVLCTGIEGIDEDDKLKILNEEVQDIYTSLYKFDENNQAVLFDIDEAKKVKEEMLNKINKLLEYLESINDGSFAVVDQVTEYVNRW